MPRILVTAGSERRGSLNRRLANVASGLARATGADVTDLDLRALQLPVYDGDVEAAGMPAGALQLRDLFASHDAIVVATPEYNGFVPPLIVNALDWVSRVPGDGDRPAGLAATAGTIVGLMSASPGNYGGMRSLMALRSFLSMNLGMLVLPQVHALAQAHNAFDAEGKLVDAKQQAGVERVVKAVIDMASAVAATEG